jgi:UDP-N-acetylglucosamine--N-acetylmuramyl-(pentapeptide) pyrophosphoryl-undecaprenol N-acetylglucosamine transferase
MSPQRLAAIIGSLDRAKLLEMAAKARAMAKPDAAKTVAARCMQLSGMGAE